MSHLPPLLPLTRERIAACLADHDYVYTVDDDGDITASWDGSRFWFLLLGESQEILQIRGRWHRTLPQNAAMAAMQVANDWHRERIIPKTYVRRESTGIGIYAETSLDLEHGITDDQLDDAISTGLRAGIHFFESLQHSLPHDAMEDVPDEDSSDE